MDLVLDIGGTKTRVGFIGDARNLLETSFFPTSKNFDDEINKIFRYLNDKDVRIINICIGLPGVLDKRKEMLYSSPNLRGWIGKPIKKVFEKEFSSKVILENDAALAGLGESVYGAGKDFKIVTYLTISTGIGGVRIVNKYIDDKTYGFEPGQHILFGKCCNSNGIPGKGMLTFEDIVSGKSIKRIYGKLPEEITDGKLWDKIMDDLSVGIANTIYYWSPEVIVLGGGVTHSDNFDLKLLKSKIEKIVENTYPSIPEIKKSVLGDFSGIYGGIYYLNNYSKF